MPKIRRENIPPALFVHLVDRRLKWGISYEQLLEFGAWLDTNPEVPFGGWFKRFPNFFICGEGELIKTFLPKGRLPQGTEVF